MATSYQWYTIAPEFLLSDSFYAGHPVNPAIAATATGSAYLGGWTYDAAQDGLAGHLVGANGLPFGQDFVISQAMSGDRSDMSLAALSNGRYIATYTDTRMDPGGDIHGQILNVYGTPFANDFTIADSTIDENSSDVAGLPGGGFVVTYAEEGPDFTIRAVV